MEGIGIQNNITFDDRQFTVHTGYDPNKNQAISEVFEKGNFIFSTSNHYQVRTRESRNVDEYYLKTITHQLHSNVLEEIRSIFLINEKVKLLRQPNPHFRLGKIFFNRNFYHEAVDNFERTVKLKPQHIKAHKLLGLIHLKQRNFTKAEQVLQTALELQPDYPDILNSLGVIYSHIGKYELARDAIQRALDIKPDFHEANFNLGILLFLSTIADNKNNQTVVLPARVLRSFKQVRELSAYEETQWQDLFSKTENILSGGKKDDVISALCDLQITLASYENLNISMDSFFLTFMYGGRELERDELDRFEEMFREDADSLANYADYWNELGVMHLIKCRDYFLKAMNEFERAVKINPKYEHANSSLELMRHGKKGFLILLRAILK